MCNLSQPNRRVTLSLLLGGVSALAVSGRARPARADAAPVDLPPPGPRDTCPVCGMFVAKYPDWVATVVFADGVALHFDGAKDFFKFLADVPHYAPGYSRAQITGMGVTDYYDVALVQAEDALFSIGSDVLGPMGHELVPLATEADAGDFMRDHQGKRLVRFAEVTPEMLAGLDAGRFE